MCGVVASLGKHDDAFEEALKRIAHRGVRTKVVATRRGVVGHSRLPIVGLGEEHDQPIFSSPWTVGFVGEILDFKETHPHYESDVQLIPELVRDGFHGRDGFWGVAAINTNTGSLSVLTDYLGQKPMYYRSDFPSAASEPAALLPFGPTSWDQIYFSAVRKWGYCPDLTRTPWAQIKHLLPGERVKIYQTGKVDREQYDRVRRIQMSENSIRTEIMKAVERRVTSSDVPVAALVSGGVDSSIVYRLAEAIGAIVPYHTRSNGVSFDLAEEERACKVSRGKLKIVSMVDWSAPDPAHLQNALREMQEPIDLGSLLQQRMLASAVEQDVCLTGDGADEVFGGYPRSVRYDSQYSDVFQELPAWHLPRLDRIMMRNRVEVRSPFLARRVVQGALALPWDRRKDKIALREMFKGWLPDEYLQAPKVPMKRSIVEQDPDQYRAHLIDEFKKIFEGETVQ